MDRCSGSEGCCYYGAHILWDAHIWRVSCQNSIMHVEHNSTDFLMHEEQILAEFVTHAEQTVTKYGEGAPAHISAASPRRRGPTLAIKLPSCCDAAWRRDSEWTDPRQVYQLRWRSAKAIGIFHAKVAIALSCKFSINSSLQFCENSTLRATQF